MALAALAARCESQCVLGLGEAVAAAAAAQTWGPVEVVEWLVAAAAQGAMKEVTVLCLLVVVPGNATAAGGMKVGAPCLGVGTAVAAAGVEFHAPELAAAVGLQSGAPAVAAAAVVHYLADAWCCPADMVWKVKQAAHLAVQARRRARSIEGMVVCGRVAAA